MRSLILAAALAASALPLAPAAAQQAPAAGILLDGTRLDVVATGFARAREADATRSFGMFSCSKATNELNYAAQKFSRVVLHSNNIDSCNRT